MHSDALIAAGQVDGRRRVVIEGLWPAVSGGAPVKRVVGDRFIVEADLLVDGHDRLAGRLMYRRVGGAWSEAVLISSMATASPRATREDDRWWGAFQLDAVGAWEYAVSAWVDEWETWLWAIKRKLGAGQDVASDILAGAELVAAAAARATGSARGALLEYEKALRCDGSLRTAGLAPATERDLTTLMGAHPDRSAATTQDAPLTVTVEPRRAAFGSWYEMFPRSRVRDPALPDAPAKLEHGTFADAAKRLAYVAAMGFDVVYLPPIHPIGRTHRKGPDNSLTSTDGDPGSPWAIGNATGGHKGIHPQLGTLDDFRELVGAARAQGLEVALDIALQASPDHPYVTSHPEWFVHRPDGTIQYAENPPKKYEDIYPFAFAGAAWEALWNELRDVFLFWIDQGVTIFRVDNPHTKPLPFWRWCLASVKEREPRAIFLAEAFTRPKLMRALAKAGFSQSYTYFTWRTTKDELTSYVQSLLAGDSPQYFRPSFWPNTPDILPEQLQHGTRGTFVARAALAATLSPNWGVYGPAFELQEKVARPGSEEYAHNEKYELRLWDVDQPGTIAPILKRLNQIRRDNPALQRLEGTVFHKIDNPSLLAYSRVTDDRTNAVLVVVNLDPHHKQSGWLSLDLGALGVPPDASFQVHDLMGDARYLWRGTSAFVELTPSVMPVQIFRVHRHDRSERSFEYYL